MTTEAEQVIVTQCSWWHQDVEIEEKPAVVAPIGGANAQCRFSGKSAKPIFRSVPVSGAPVTITQAAAALEEAAKKTWSLPAQGYTCDGTTPGGAPASRWRFDFGRWSWLVVGTEEEAGDRAAAQLAQHAIAARRWGDGRDDLAPAVSSKKKATAVASSDGGGGGAKRSKVVHVERSNPLKDPSTDGFAAVGGFSREKELLKREILNPLRLPAVMKRLGLPLGRGMLLLGPPGSGKTFLARAVAAEGGFHLVTVAGAECVGSAAAEAKLRKAFETARDAAPSVLFLDEVDALAPSRKASGSSDTEQKSTALTLALIDDLRKSGANVAVVAASSRADAVDASMRRAGRLDVELALGAPGESDREEILRCVVAGMPLQPELDLTVVSRRLQGYMAGDVAGAAEEAALQCICEAVGAAEATGQLPALLQGDPQALAEIKVGQRHFDVAVDALGPAVLRGLAAETPRDIDWESIGGLDGVKDELRELVEWPLVHGAKLAAAGLTPEPGALLYGPPGCGKTLLAKAVAACCGANFISIRGPELLQKWLGESERAVREVFAAARAAAPCVVFFDEIDAVATRRGGGSTGAAAGGDASAARVLNQLLCELDGTSGRHAAVFVLAATNRPASLDPALLRPGRLGRVLKVPLPDASARGSILSRALRRCPVAVDLDLNAFGASEAMQGFSGADVAEVARRAGTALVRQEIIGRGGGCLEASHLEVAMLGMRRSVSDKDAAYHDGIEGKLMDGSLEEGKSQQQQMVQVAAAVRQACGKHVNTLHARVQQLEAAMKAAGVEIPPQPGTSTAAVASSGLQAGPSQ